MTNVNDMTNMTNISTPSGIPPEFARHFRQSGLTDPWEPLYSRRMEHAIHLGLVAGLAHANSRGFVHGGLLAAMADNAMGLSCAQVLGESRLVTINLAIDFVGTAKLGHWLEFCPTVIKIGKNLCFAGALVLADGAICARANATFQRSS